jgi:FtsZ-binding cell division protein ZapB
MTIPALPLAVAPNAPPSSEILICVPFCTCESRDFPRSLSSGFGLRAVLSQVSRVPDRWVIESGFGASAVPSLSALDRAFHEVETLPREIDRVLIETVELRTVVENVQIEIEELRRKKDWLVRDIEESRTALSSLQNKELRKTACSFRKSSKRLVDRLLPPSEDVSSDGLFEGTGLGCHRGIGGTRRRLIAPR